MTEDGTRVGSTDKNNQGRAFLQGIAAMVGGLIALLVVLVLGINGCALYLNWSAQKNASEFCDAIALGSKTSVAASRAKSLKIMTVGGDDEVNFFFPSVPFRVVTCHISKNRDGMVISKEIIVSND